MKGLSKPPRVARWLLHSLASMLTLNLAGCLWPTSLTDELKPVNSPPVLIKADPPFGQMIVAANQRLDLNLTAVDRDPDDKNSLHARIFKSGAQTDSRIYQGYETTLTYPAGTDPSKNPLTPLTGSFFPDGSVIICSAFDDGDELFVVVADRTFSNLPGLENTAPGGLTNENHWELKCQ